MTGISKEKLQQASKEAITKTNNHLGDFLDGFPSSESKEYIYQSTPNKSWTEGFYTGILLLAYEMCKDERYTHYINNHIESFKERVENSIALNHHDLGFLYTLSCVSAYKVLGWEEGKKCALMAADCLLERWKPKGEFIQAWGDINDDSNYRLIIDCLLNLPLLYWASDETGDHRYREIAVKHADTCRSVIIRPDNTTFHTYYFDHSTGAPSKGVTHQGFSDDSCWSRGQAWGIYGFALSYLYTKDETFIESYDRVTDYFIKNLANDNIPYWDLCFTDGDEPRDTSAAAIAICGILEMSKYIDRPEHMEMANKMMESLIDNYTTKDMPNCNGLLTDAMYSRPNGGQPECNIWGDYFYMEALMRYQNPSWRLYW